MAEKFRLIGESTRLAILHALMEGTEKSVEEVASETGRSEVNVSRHLKQLAGARMVARRKEGLQVFYRLPDPVIEELCRLVCGSLLKNPTDRPSGGESPTRVPVTGVE